MTAYQSLEALFRRLSALGEAAGMLHWDASCMMPKNSSEARGEQLAVLGAVRHEMLTAPSTADLLDAAEAEGGLDDWQRANLHEMRRTYIHASAVDSALVEAKTKACMACEMIWRDARPKSDFAAVRNHLREVVKLTRETAEAKAAKLNLAPYDAMMDQYSPGMRRTQVDPIFARLTKTLPDMIDRALAKQAAAPAAIQPKGPFPAADQRAVGTHFMRLLGFDFDKGRLDISEHPFSGGTPDDLRITTRYDEDDFTRGLMGILHETGHALYEAGLPADWRLQPVGEARGMDIHESQSLLIEMQVCRSAEFLTFAAPHLKQAFNGTGPTWEPANLARIYSRVERSFIRVDADEMTYPLHVILRYRVEQALLSGDLQVADLPGAWNQLMNELLQIVPSEDRLGCLQDIHWYDGGFGYFPSYTFGALAAAQFFASARRDDPQLLPAVAQGDFKPLYAWLRPQIHSQGSRHEAPELIERATGAPLSVEPFLAHLERRYLA